MGRLAFGNIYISSAGGLCSVSGNYYVSTDFSKDGEILTLQTHTKGNGIKLVVMGDLFVDVEMGEGGRYETIMKETMENYFQ